MIIISNKAWDAGNHFYIIVFNNFLPYSASSSGVNLISNLCNNLEYFFFSSVNTYLNISRIGFIINKEKPRSFVELSALVDLLVQQFFYSLKNQLPQRFLHHVSTSPPYFLA